MAADFVNSETACPTGMSNCIKVEKLGAKEREKRESEMEDEDKALKSQMALRRCAKAALLLSELKSLPTLSLQDNTVDYQDERMLRREIEDLKIELVKERLNNKKIKLCALVEFIVQIMLLLSLWTFLLVFALKTR